MFREDLQKTIAGLQCTSYIEHINLWHLDSLQIRRIKLDLIMCYNIIHGNICIDCSRFFTVIKSSCTRGHNYKIYKRQCHLDVCKYRFSFRVVDIWNNLPSNIVNAESINSFKNRLDSINCSQYL